MAVELLKPSFCPRPECHQIQSNKCHDIDDISDDEIYVDAILPTTVSYKCETNQQKGPHLPLSLLLNPTFI